MNKCQIDIKLIAHEIRVKTCCIVAQSQVMCSIEKDLIFECFLHWLSTIIRR